MTTSSNSVPPPAYSGRQVGYIRVSSIEQNLDRQLDNVPLHKVFKDTCSGGSSNRPGLKSCMDFLWNGDTLHVHSIDRLARNLRDLLNILQDLQTREVTVVFHKEHLTFTSEKNPFQELQLQIIGAVAAFERAMIRARQAEGIAKAKTRGVYKGRKAKLTPEEVTTILKRRDAGESVASLAREYGISRVQLYAYFRKAEGVLHLEHPVAPAQ